MDQSFLLRRRRLSITGLSPPNATPRQTILKPRSFSLFSSLQGEGNWGCWTIPNHACVNKYPDYVQGLTWGFYSCCCLPANSVPYPSPPRIAPRLTKIAVMIFTRLMNLRIFRNTSFKSKLIENWAASSHPVSDSVSTLARRIFRWLLTCLGVFRLHWSGQESFLIIISILMRAIHVVRV